MTSDPGAYTLVVTSRHNNWTRAQVPARYVGQHEFGNTPKLTGQVPILLFDSSPNNLQKRLQPLKITNWKIGKIHLDIREDTAVDICENK